jgi:nicotinate phosphoribosyltransferase
MKIYASSSFDEFKIADMVKAGAPIDAFGVGTRVGVSADAPYLDIVYKLVRLGNRDIRKLSPGKVTLAGPKQVFRRLDGEGRYQEDLIGCREEAIPGTKPLLTPVMGRGHRLHPATALEEIRRKFETQAACLQERYKSIHRYEAYPVIVSPRLKSLQP